MPTRRGGPRQPRQRIEPEVAPVRRASAAAAEAKGESKAARRNPLFPLGVSLYPLDAESQGPEEWYGRDLADDLAVFAEARLALARVFVSWRVLEPQVGQYDEQGLQRLSDLVAALGRNKMQVIVCFFADDRHAELVDVPWAKKRDPRTDNYLLQRETALIAKVVGRLRAEPAIFGWQLANEAFCSGFETAEALEAWVSAMREAIREHETVKPIVLGVDAEAFYRSTGVDARAAVDSCEFAVSHVTAAYRAYAAEGPITSGPSTYLDTYLLRHARRGVPVLLDDVGVIALDTSLGEEAAYVRNVLWGGFMNRSAGAMLRRYRDMDTERREPYFLDPFETLVGFADADGVVKPAFEEASKFVRAIARIDLRTHQLLAERTAVLVPSERYAPLPSLAGLFEPRACLASYIAAKQAHVPVAVVRENDDFDEYSVILVPSAFALSDDAWERLGAFVQQGGSLVLSYGGGDAHPAIRDLFGIEFLGDGGPRERISCRVAQADILGALESFDAALEVPNFALLSGGTATIVATDAKGSPLLTVNQVGQGRAVYIAVPIERAIAQGDAWATPVAVSHMLREVYGAVARGAGCGAPVGCDSPDVEVALLQGDSDDVLLLLNHSAAPLNAGLTTERRVASIVDVRGGAPVAVGGTEFGVPIEANGVVALRLSYA